MLNESETDRPPMGAPMVAEVPQAAFAGGSSDSLSTAFLYERTDVDRAAEPSHPWERSSAEERYDNWHTDWGVGSDW